MTTSHPTQAVILSAFFPSVVVSEMPYESFAHWPVEMLPLICPRDQRKAAKLQVRPHVTTEGEASWEAALLSDARFTFHVISSERRWPRLTTLRWIKSAWRLCRIRYTHSRGKHTVCLILSWLLSSHIYSLFPPDLGGLHQFSQRSVGVTFVFLATLHRATEPNDWSCHLLISSVRLWARTPRTSGSQRCGGSTREAVSTPWSTLSSSGEIIANMRRWVSHRGIYFWLFTYR